jgi:hypothetical protein
VKYCLKLIPIFIVINLLFGLTTPVYGQMDPKLKALGSMALYGTVGGFLLGTASLAFGTEPRTIAKGASLGLYAGLLFGGYVVVSHILKEKGKDSPLPPDAYPIDYPGDYGGGYEGGEEYENTPYDEKWAEYFELENNSEKLKGNYLRKLNQSLEKVFYFQLFQIAF